MPVRITEIPGLQGQAINAPNMNPNAAAASGAALGQFAQTIAAVGGELGGMASRIQDVENARTESQIQNAWQTELSDLQSKLQTATPGERVSKTDALLSKLQHSYDMPGVSPVVRDRLAMKYDDWATRARTATAADSMRLEAKNSYDMFRANWEEAERLGDREKAEQALETRRAYGLVGEGEEKLLWASFDRKEALTGITNMIFQNPVEAKAELESEGFVERTPGISEADRLGFLKNAESEISMLERESMKKLSDQMERGEIVTEGELDAAMAENPILADGYKDELRFSLTQKTPVDAETRFALVDSLNDLHDAFKKGEMSVEDYRQAHDELSRAVYSLGARDGAGALRQRVHALDPANWTDDESTATRDLKEMDKAKTLLRSVESIGKLYADQDAFGNIDEDAEPAERAQQAVAAQQMRLRIEADVGKWLSQNPEASEEEISTRYRKSYMNALTGPLLETGATTPAERRRKMLEELDVEDTETSDNGPKGASDSISSEPVGGDLKAMVRHFEAGGEKEGFHATAYDDGPQYSIGYGTKSRPGETITKEEAERRLDVELASHRKRVLEEAGKIGMEFTPNELDALTSFDFNTGRIGQLLAGGTRTKAEIASKMLLYRKAGGKRLAGLERRRIAESTVFRRGYGEQRAAEPNPEESKDATAIPQ